MENWEALDIKRDGSLSLRAGLIEGGGHSCGVVVAAAYLCRRAVERWSARPSVEVSRPVLWNLWSSCEAMYTSCRDQAPVEYVRGSLLLSTD